MFSNNNHSNIFSVPNVFGNDKIEWSDIGIIKKSISYDNPLTVYNPGIYMIEELKLNVLLVIT